MCTNSWCRPKTGARPDDVRSRTGSTIRWPRSSPAPNGSPAASSTMTRRDLSHPQVAAARRAHRPNQTFARKRLRRARPSN
jgi:hypothetical protein